MIRTLTTSSRPVATGLAVRGALALAPVADPAERRAFGRRPCRIAAEIRYRRYRIACVVLDESEGGAFLSLDDAEMLPAQVTLVIPGHGIEILVDVRHRSKAGVGVRFLRGDIATFRDTFCRDVKKAAPSTLPRVVAEVPSRERTRPQQIESSVALRRSLLRVVTGGLEAAKRMLAGVPLVLRRPARRAVVVGATLAIARHRLLDAGARPAQPFVPFVEVGQG